MGYLIHQRDVKQSHASAIESYIEKYIGFDLEGNYRDKDEIGSMYFQKTLEDWAKFDINNRTKFDCKYQFRTSNNGKSKTPIYSN